MTIDERIERLTESLENLKERHVTLTQSLEIMVHDHQATQRDMRDVMGAVARLLHIAQIREHRITRLEGGTG